MFRAVVVGGTFSGVSAACALAGAGGRVTLVDEHAFLGGQAVACRHAWQVQGDGRRISLPNGRAKMDLYARARNAGVELLLTARLCGVLTDGERACGVVIATKFGLFQVPADLVLDATEERACAYHLTGERAVASFAEFSYDMGGVDAPFSPSEPMPGALGLEEDRVLLGETPAERTVQVSFRFPLADGDRADRSALERRAHELMVKTAVCLRARPGFSRAVISLPASHTRLQYASVPADGRVTALESALPPEYTAREREDLEAGAARDALLALAGLAPAGGARDWFCAGRLISGWRAEWDEGEALLRVRFDPTRQGFPEKRADVLLAGAGTGGAMAGWACVLRGVDLLAFDQLYYAGGTNTVGRVHSAWHGYVDGMYAERARQAAAQPDAQAMAPRVSAMMYWERLFGGRLMGGATLCGAGLEAGRLAWALAAGEEGLMILRGRYVIDGTADGDLCALAGLPCEVGGGRDGIVQTSSMWGFETRTPADFAENRYNSDEDMIAPDSYRDLLRGFSLGYRHNSEYEIVELCMQRESRRFACRHPLSMADIARRDCPWDTIAVGYCRHDTHGAPSSLMNRFRLYSEAMNEPGCDDIRIRVPFGMFLPVGVDNLAIVGKSMSGQREAVNLCRMNPDLSNAAFAAGWMTARAALSGEELPLPALDPRTEQPALAALRVLPDWALRPGDALGIPEALRRLEDPGDGGFASMVQEEAQIVPPLLERLAQPGPVGDNAALALAWHGRREAGPRLSQMLRRELPLDIRFFEVREGLEVWGIRADGFERIVNPNERYGYVSVAMDDPDFSYGRVNRLIVLMGLCGAADPALLLPLAERADPGALLTGKTPYARSRRDTHRFVQEVRLWALGNAFERLADRRYAPTLARLLEAPVLSHLSVPGEGWLPVTPPRAAFTELLLARSAAHCGSREGALRLTEYARDQRLVFARAARRALAEVFPGQSHSPDAWEAYIRALDELPVVPYRGSPYDG